MRYLLLLLSACAALTCLTLLSSAQSTVNKFPHAIERSKDAARIISLLAVPESEMPKELITRTKALGVFPEVRKETAMFSSSTMGYGVISARLKNGWSAPAFYAFGGGGYGNPFAKTEKMAVLLLFLSDDAVTAFEKGGVALKNEKHADAGPVGELSDQQRKDLADAKIVAYTYYNGKLNGTTFGKSFWKSFGLNPDNKINTPLYGIKGREVLAGKEVDVAKLPAGIMAYQEALQKYFPAP